MCQVGRILPVGSSWGQCPEVPLLLHTCGVSQTLAHGVSGGLALSYGRLPSAISAKILWIIWESKLDCTGRLQWGVCQGLHQVLCKLGSSVLAVSDGDCDQVLGLLRSSLVALPEDSGQWMPDVTE